MVQFRLELKFLFNRPAGGGKVGRRPPPLMLRGFAVQYSINRVFVVAGRCGFIRRSEISLLQCYLWTVEKLRISKESITSRIKSLDEQTGRDPSGDAG